MDKKTLASKIFIDFSEEEWKEVDKEFEIFNEELKHLKAINTDNVEAMDLPFTLNENNMRMDTEGEILTVEELLSNAPDKSEEYLRIVKVVS